MLRGEGLPCCHIHTYPKMSLYRDSLGDKPFEMHKNPKQQHEHNSGHQGEFEETSPQQEPDSPDHQPALDEAFFAAH